MKDEDKHRGPDFICIGAQKSGSTWVYRALQGHPDVAFGRLKEIEFFNDRFVFYHSARNNRYKKGVAWYKRQLDAQPQKLAGEVSPLYIWDPVVARRIHKHFPKTKIIAVLRNPVDRAYSEYNYSNAGIFIADTFEEAIAQHPEYLDRGYYARQLKRFYRFFPKEQVKVILFEDIKDRPEQTYKELERFLGLKHAQPKDIGKSPNPTKVLKYRWVTKFFRFLQPVKHTWLGKKLWGIDWLNRKKNYALAYLTRFCYTQGKYPKMDTKTRKKLIKHFAKHNDELSRLIGRDLKMWNT